MLRMTPSCPVYLALGPTDLRNNIDGLLDGLSIEQAVFFSHLLYWAS